MLDYYCVMFKIFIQLHNSEVRR